MDFQQLLFLLILAGGLYLFVSERLRVDVTAMLVLLALVVTGVLDAEQALSGFASEPAIIVAAVFVISGGLAATGITERLGQWIGRAAGRSESRAVAVLMPAVAALSAFTHHVMVTAMMLPITLRHAREQNSLPASRLLMPMSLAASLGTTLTLVSAPAFLLAERHDRAQRRQARSASFRSPRSGSRWSSWAWSTCSSRAGCCRKRSGAHGDDGYLRLDRYRTELLVVEGSRWSTRPLAELQKALGDRFRMRGWLRDGKPRNDLRASQSAAGRRHPAGGSRRRRTDVAARRSRPGPQRDRALRRHPGWRRRGAAGAGGGRAGFGIHRPLDPRTGFLAPVPGGDRRPVAARGDLGDRMADARLREGDLLVLYGRPSHFGDLAAHHGFLMLVPFAGQAKRRLRAPLALVILAATILAAATEWLPASLAFLFGAVAMVVTRCVDVDQAYRGVDVRIFVMIAGVIPLGIAMEQTGTARLLANGLLHVVAALAGAGRAAGDVLGWPRC